MPTDIVSLTDKQESSKLAWIVMNQMIKEKNISKQECMVHLSQLPLFECSETIETVSISGSYKLDNEGQSKGTSFFHKYANRTSDWYLSLHIFFHTEKIKRQEKFRK